MTATHHSRHAADMPSTNTTATDYSSTSGTLTATENTPLLSSTSSDTAHEDEAYTSFPESASRPRAPSEASSHVPRPQLSLPRAVAVCFNAWLLLFLQSTNMSGMTMVQGAIAEELVAHEIAMWFTSSFFIAMSCTGPLMGRLGTIFSPRYLFLPTAVLVAIGSLICSAAQSTPVFLLGRVVAGLGAGGILSLIVMMVLELTTKANRGLFVGLVNAGVTLGVSFGAIVYGALEPVIGWRPLFLVQTPLSLIAGIGLFISLPQMPSQQDKTKSDDDEISIGTKLASIDYLGAILLMITTVLFLYSLAGDIQPYTLVASLGALMVFIAFEYSFAKNPVIPLDVISSRGVLFSCLAQTLLMASRWSVLYYSPIFMLAVIGDNPASAGSMLIPTNVGFGLGGLVVGWLHIRRNGAFWLPCLLCIAVFGITLYIMSRVLAVPRASIPGFIVAIVINGLATGAALNYTLAHLLHLSQKKHRYVTTSLLGTFRGFGASFGTSIGGGIFFRVLRSNLTTAFMALDGGNTLSPERQRLISRLLGTPSLVYHGHLSPAAHDIAVDSYAAATGGVWRTAAIGTIIIMAVQATTGWVAPQDDDDEDVEEARARMEEHEGPGEA